MGRPACPERYRIELETTWSVIARPSTLAFTPWSNRAAFRTA
jgi:hypothetical protein